MSRVTKFLENELDKVNDFLGMAKASLILPTELCEDNCKNIASNLDETYESIIAKLNEILPEIEERVSQAKDIIYSFKNDLYDMSEISEINNK